jgi:hypothetical protein
LAAPEPISRTATRTATRSPRRKRLEFGRANYRASGGETFKKMAPKAATAARKLLAHIQRLYDVVAP